VGGPIPPIPPGSDAYVALTTRAIDLWLCSPLYSSCGSAELAGPENVRMGNVRMENDGPVKLSIIIIIIIIIGFL